MPAVLVTRGVPEPVREHLADRCDLEVWAGEGVMPRAELLARVAGRAGLLAMLTDRVDAELLDAAGPGLRVVANYAVGHDNLDLAACTARGVLATNTPDVVTEATADLAWALLLAAARRVAEGDRFLRGRRPWIWGPEFFLGFEVHGKTLGVIGLGRIGRAVARRAAGFAMPVLYTARRRLARAGPAARRGRLRERPHRPLAGHPAPDRTRAAGPHEADGGAGQHRPGPDRGRGRPGRRPAGRPAGGRRPRRVRAGAGGPPRPARAGQGHHRPPPGHGHPGDPGRHGHDRGRQRAGRPGGPPAPEPAQPGGPALGAQVALLAHPVGLGQPGGDLLVHVLEALQPELVQVVAGRERLHPPEAGMLQPPGQHHVPVDPVPAQRKGGEAHPHLEGDP